LSNDRITFGSFNNLNKINDSVVALWARLLGAVPESQLLIKGKQFSDEAVRQAMVDRFAVHGIDAQRLILISHVPTGQHLYPFQRVDISLDPFPYQGITTTVESLYMGVPVLTLAGTTFLSRQGVGLLTNAGLPEWIAVDADDYVARGVRMPAIGTRWLPSARVAGTRAGIANLRTPRACPSLRRRCAQCGSRGARQQSCA
jgi:predicted O-linked N-acetylglucosamine transferase (SPINDLY family)